MMPTPAMAAYSNSGVANKSFPTNKTGKASPRRNRTLPGLKIADCRFCNLTIDGLLPDTGTW
jgi:hypothetical protein